MTVRFLHIPLRQGPSPVDTSHVPRNPRSERRPWRSLAPLQPGAHSLVNEPRSSFPSFFFCVTNTARRTQAEPCSIHDHTGPLRVASTLILAPTLWTSIPVDLRTGQAASSRLARCFQHPKSNERYHQDDRGPSGSPQVYLVAHFGSAACLSLEVDGAQSAVPTVAACRDARRA